jgi:Uma2 family endonuclease
MVMMVADTYLPVSLSIPDMTDAQFQELCEQYADYRLEYTSEGELIILPPTDRDTGLRNSLINYQLTKWFLETGKGIVSDSSAGFILPNGARRSPDAAWTSDERGAQSSTICPEFVIELQSPSDKAKRVHEKMLEWLSNGAELGWLIDPRTRTVTIYRRHQAPEVRREMTSIEGEGPVAGFTLDLQRIWAV